MSKRPNIVFILTDQQRLDTIRALGFDHMTTPHLDALARRGTAFNKMYVTSPSCAPSRASLFSGTYPHTNGVFRNDEPWNYCWVTELAKAGYRTVNVGKMHTMPVEGAFGFHERHVVENKDRDSPNVPFYLDNWDKAFFLEGKEKPSRVTQRRRDDYGDLLGAWVWEHEEKLHPDIFVGRTACWWLDRYPGDEPFFLQVGLPGPHPPYDPTQADLDHYGGQDLPPRISDSDVPDQPKAYQKLRQHHFDMDADGIVHLDDASSEQAQRQRAHYYANVTLIDRMVGEIVATLEKRGVLDDTVIIFASDHGDCLGDHGHSQKWNMYENSVRVPAIISWPGQLPEDHVVDDLVAHFDIGPTILELAGVDVPEWMEARSLLPLMSPDRGPDQQRERVFSEHADDKIMTGTRFVTMVREGQLKLVHFVDDDHGQLFDLEADPDELHNLWNDPAHQAVKDRLIGEILKWRLESAVSTQWFIAACIQNAASMHAPPGSSALGQHRGNSR